MASANGNVDWQMASRTDVGLLRRRNEDSVRIIPSFGIAVLSDGMGGLHAGDIASRLAIDSVVDDLGVSEPAPHHGTRNVEVDPEILSGILQRANAAIRRAARDDHENRRMGATILVVVFTGARFIAAHLGDSRLYRFAGERLDRLTSDHTLAERFGKTETRASGETRRGWEKNVLTRALGIDEMVVPEFTEGPVSGNDLFLLCSDGLTDAVSELDIEQLLKQDDMNLQQKVDDLIALANRNGGPDNISVVLVRPGPRNPHTGDVHHDDEPRL